MAEIAAGSGNVVTGVTFADFAAGGGGDCAWATGAAISVRASARMDTFGAMDSAKTTRSEAPARQIEFFYDLGSPYAWLTAERIDALFTTQPIWTPVLLGGIFKVRGRGSWAETERRAEGIAEVERRAARYGLPPLRWPEPWPNNGLQVMRVAAHADSHEFALTAFRAHFTEGLALSDPANVAGVAARVGIEPLEDKQRLRENTDRALELGVIGVPTVAVGGELYWGDDRMEEAAASVREQQLQ